MQIRKTFVNNKLVALGDCKITTKVEKPKYTIKIYRNCSDFYIGEYLSCDLYKFYSNMRDYFTNLSIDDLADVTKYKNFGHMITELNKSDKHNAYYIIYGISHGGVYLSFDDFHDKWDSGVAGVLKIRKCKNYRKIAKTWLDTINAILTDNIVGYHIYDELNNIVDSCSGFIVLDKDTTISSIYNTIPSEYNITKEDITKSMNEVS